MKINILRVIMHRHLFKVLLLCISLIVLYTTIRYTHIYTVFDVIAKHDIKDNLVTTETDELPCPLNFHDDAHILHPILNITENATWSEIAHLNAGEWWPTHCTSTYKIAIIVPYRDRAFHLNIFLHHMHSFLRKQNIHYKIYVVEQIDDNKFNRGKLFNVGYVEALKEQPFPCFIFHDVDLLPQNLNNIYACTKFPRHMSSSIDRFRYHVPYDRNFGGVVAILTGQYKTINGFSNIFYGWGGEDDDFFNRIIKSGLRVVRFSQSISRYYSLPHAAVEPSADRFKKMYISDTTSKLDGLKSLYYRIKTKENLPSHVKISVYV